MNDPSVFQWVELERFMRPRPDGQRQTVVRARCSCGRARVMPAWQFDSRHCLRCKACHRANLRAMGFGSPRLIRKRDGQVV